MSNQTIATYFESRLQTWAQAQNPVVPIAFENVAFDRAAVSTPWLEPFLIPNTTMNKEVSGQRKTHLGLYHVNCWAPKGEGMGDVRALADSVIALFPLLPKGAVSIEETPSASRPLPDGDNWVVVPVLIKYRYESN